MLVTLKQFCETNGLPFERVKRMARKNEIVGAAKTLGRWGIDSDAPIPVLPETRSGNVGRVDGRFVYRIWATPTEATTLETDGFALRRANPTKPKAETK